ncbi:MAG: UdgX family uracil-DNA binding protein [Hyphomicrobiales bacterium]
MKYSVSLPRDADEAAFRAVARRGIAASLTPDELDFVSGDEPSFFAPLPETSSAPAFSVPRAFAELLSDAICNSAPDRFALLYEVLWRSLHGERELAQNHADPAVARLQKYAHHVRRDIHKMHAFVRFREHSLDGAHIYTSWFEPQHFILRRAIPFFVDRFSKMNWLIATPIGTAHWDQHHLSFGPPVARPKQGNDAVLDDLWLTYFKTTFNPARLRKKAMLAEMPKHYWSNMPETALIPDMIAKAQIRVEDMVARAPLPPPRFAEKLSKAPETPIDVNEGSLKALNAEIATCKRCPLHCAATQAVRGEGPSEAAIMLVGEQPGDEEDLAGRPFVGPAGRLLDKALGEAGLSRDGLYVTNTVKHFKYEPRGKRRIHQKPSTGEVQTCKWWLDREIAIIRPKLVVAMGATAAGALAGRPVSVTRERGSAKFDGGQGYVTVHPSYLLRLPDPARKAEEYERFVADLKRVAAA